MVTITEHLKKASAIGSYTCVFAYTNEDGVRYNSTGKLLFEKLVEVLYKNTNDRNEANKRFARVRNTFLKLEKFRVIRNSVCHSDKETVDKEKVRFFTGEEYYNAKKLVFDDCFITEISGYYKKLF